MGIFDFLRKKKESTKEEIYSPPIKNDIATQRRGYHKISDTCLSKNKREKFKEFIENLKDYNDDEEYMTTLNYVVDYISQKKMYFIICLDWKGSCPIVS